MTRRLLALGVGCLLALSACSSGPTTAPATSSVPSASPSPTPTPTPSATPAPTPTPTPVWTSPLDGMPGDGPAPVLVVKLDNTQYALPHAGLTRADVVYVEEVEYGITRLAAVFSDSVPERIGPVRSARITDIDLLAQYGEPAFAYSGAQRKMFPFLDAAPFRDVSPRTSGEGYSRDGNRYAPYNYFLDGQTALARAPKAALSKDMGFVFDGQVPAGGRAATSADMKWGYSAAGFDYSEELGQYLVRLNGRKASAEESKRGQAASTVVIQYVKQRPSAFFDKGGGNTPHAQTIGTGRAIVMRDGQAWDATWSRPTAEDGTTFTLDDGSVIAFKPGQVWIVLLDSKRRARLEPVASASSSASSSDDPSASGSPGAQ